MSRIRDLASILTASSSMATDTEVSAVSAQIPTNVAGKNLIINGGFDYWQRGTSLALSSSYAYLADRFSATVRNGAGTQSRHTLTAEESALCANLKYAYKFDVTTQATNTNPKIYQGIEDSWYYYGKTITISFYAKASKSITLNAASDLIWANADNISPNNSFSLTTTFQRFNYTFSLSPSGTYNSATDYLGLQVFFTTPMNDTYTVYITGVQAEFGSTLTPFSRAGGHLQGELAACQRYYYKIGPYNSSEPFGQGMFYSGTQSHILVTPQVQLRTSPSSIDYAGSFQHLAGASTFSGGTITNGGSESGRNLFKIFVATSGATSGQYCQLRANGDATAYIAFNAEL